MAFDYPILLDLTGVRVLVVGGGRVARRKIEGLLRAGADVTAVAPEISAEVGALSVTQVVRKYRRSDLDGQRLVFIATNDPTVNRDVSHQARQRGLWVNSADDPDNCTFTLPAVARAGAVTVAVGTGGASPALASHLRGEIECWLSEIGAADAAVALAAQRSELHAQGVSTESIDWSDRVRTSLRQQP